VNFRFGQPARLKALGRRVAVEIAGEVIEPDMVWVAAGAWSNAVLAPLGAGLAQAAVRSQYWITGQTDLAVQDMPSVVAPDLKLYARRELGAVLFGVREACGVALPSTQLPSDLSGFVFDANDAEGLRTLEAAAEYLQRHAPGLMQAGLKHYISGPSCYTPDGELILGPLCDWDNLHVMGGCNGAGIARSGGWADLAVDGLASRSSSLARCDPARFGKLDANAPEFLARCVAARAGKSSA
jgi:4-methylaminobutanoate oxidase (formaldehyde-forming)